MTKTPFSLITGAAGLLGPKHAEALLEDRHNVIITDINKKKLKKVYLNLKNKFSKKNYNIISYCLDVTSEKSIKKILIFLKKEKIIINNLINNAAIDPKFVSNSKSNNELKNYDLKSWEKEIKVGLTGSFLCSKYFGNFMVENNVKGNIVNISSDLSVIAPNQSIYNNNFIKPITYSVIKHGISGLTKYLATYWSDNGIRCNSLSPGPVLNDQSNSLVKNLKKQIPLRRLANKNEYKEAIKFLCSEKSSYMNGHNLVMDGGRSIW